VTEKKPPHRVGDSGPAIQSNDELDAQVIDFDTRRARAANDEISPEFTDDSIALRFAEEYDGSHRYVAALGKWFLWDGLRWKTDDTLAARNNARLICRRAATQCNSPRTAKNIASSKTVSGVERLAQADRRLAATVDQWDADPSLLNTPAGIVDLRSGELRKHDRLAYMTKITGVAPDDSCPTPNWRAFLNRVTGNKQELVEYLQRMAGYTLTGLTSEHAMFFIYGLGANGKTTFLNALIKAAGDYHKTAPIETFTASNHDRHPTDLAALRGARLVTAVETEEGRRWAESRIKTLTGGDKISARFMRQDFFEYTPQFKLIIAGNHKPGLRSVDEAIRRRFNLIPFDVTIPPEERDENLPGKLDAELPGILDWMIAGCTDWLERGLAPPQIVTEATDAYLESEDAIAAWIEECGERDPQHWERASDLFASWTAWATKAGEYVGSQRRFAQNTETRGLSLQRRMNGRGYLGLRLKTFTYGNPLQ
jgi:putative DNA primase/helicase